MPLILPDSYPQNPIVGYPCVKGIDHLEENVSKKLLKIGIYNIMPQAEQYERLILNRLANSNYNIKPLFYKSAVHIYGSSCKKHLQEYYRTLDDFAVDPANAIILTGAPVEKLPKDKIRYWSEIDQLIRLCKNTATPLLGICWGGIAIGLFLGINTRQSDHKIFGVDKALNLNPQAALMHRIPLSFYCPQSRYAGLDEHDLARFEQNGTINRLAWSPAAGTFLFETTDKLLTGHLGHPEYLPERLVFEWRRDQRLGLNIPAYGFEPHNPMDNWSGTSQQFFENWLGHINTNS